jgi:hypothetical protein
VPHEGCVVDGGRRQPDPARGGLPRLPPHRPRATGFKFGDPQRVPAPPRDGLRSAEPSSVHATHEKAAGTEDANATEAVRLVQDVESLRPLAAGDPEMEERVSQLADEAHRAARLHNVASGPYAQEAAATLALSAEARQLRAHLVAATGVIATKALADLDKRLRDLLRQARLTQIDAIIGKKKKLEIEIEQLRDGRYPAELFATLQLEGLLGDDEEYWPFEGEYWSDEYENYK